MYAIWEFGAFYASKGEKKVKKQNGVAITELRKLFKSKCAETLGKYFILL